MRRTLPLLAAFGLLLAAPLEAAPTTPADAVYRHGRIYTANDRDEVVESVAIRGGRVVYAGPDAGLGALVGPATRSVDLHGRAAMPGIVDGHMHPLEGGSLLLKCSLNYEALTVAEFQRRIQACLDATRDREPDGWLEVVSWFQQNMQPAGVSTSSATLDVLKTSRPVIVRSSFGHTVLANTRALALAGITRGTPDPIGGKIAHDAAGQPTGILEDAAFEVYDKLLPKPTAEQDVAAARAALGAIARQGVTTFLDAAAPVESLAAFSAVQKAGGLTARAHFAPPISPAEAGELPAAVARIVALRTRYDQGPVVAAPTLTVRNAKLFLDGVIAGPSFTGAMLEPYRVNAGSEAEPRWQAGTSRGPDVYFPPAPLRKALIDLGRAGIDPHMHVDGDAAVRAALDAVAAMRQALPGKDIRPGLAHCEIVAPEDYPRMRALEVFPVLSLQWGKPASDTVDGLREPMGPARARLLEPSGLLAAKGATIAFGSDWPVDQLDEWFALKVGVTRTNAPDAGPRYAGRLGDDPGLSRLEALRAATIVAARELHVDDVTGSLEPGKYADLIVLDRDPLEIPAEEIAAVKVLETVVGGRVVYSASGATP
ncbi:MAG: amidohydrolase [Proteobacteria bacterium]|nr:amidohydrolase [Pseudomonadota bacterium]